MVATATTVGVKIFDVQNGDQLAEITVPGNYCKKVELSYSDKYFAVIFTDAQKDSAMRIYNLKDCIAWGKKEGSPQYVREIKAPRDHTINDVKWGPLDETLYYCTDQGRLIKYDTQNGKLIQASDVHRHEIFTITITRDFTMLFTCSRDGTCKLLHRDTF